MTERGQTKHPWKQPEEEQEHAGERKIKLKIEVMFSEEKKQKLLREPIKKKNATLIKVTLTAMIETSPWHLKSLT